MQAELNHHEARDLFLALLDSELPAGEERRLRAHLDSCTNCRQGWDQYARTVARVRSVQREKAPKSLATLIMRRIRRRRPGLPGLHNRVVAYRPPIEAIIPLLLAAAMAAFLILSAP